MSDSFIVSAEKSGGTAPDAFPHRCPYRPTGASREFCHETTSNYQRNSAGCCGTKDFRNIGPCNSKLRKCVACLLKGRGSSAKTVIDVARGLCLECREEASQALKPAAPPRPTRGLVFAPRVASSRPRWVQTPQKDAVPSKGSPDIPPPEQKQNPKKLAKPARSVVRANLSEEEMDAMGPLVGTLARREAQIALALLDGQEDATIARRLGISEASISVYLSQGYAKLNLGAERFGRAPRRGILCAITTRYRESVEKRASQGRAKVVVSHDMSEDERELVARYRELSDEARKNLLAMARLTK